MESAKILLDGDQFISTVDYSNLSIYYVYRVSVHLQTFKKCVVESAKVLFDGDQFISAVDYSIMAWGYVKVSYKIQINNLYSFTVKKFDPFKKSFKCI